MEWSDAAGDGRVDPVRFVEMTHPFRPLFVEVDPVKIKYELTKADLTEAILDWIEKKDYPRPEKYNLILPEFKFYLEATAVFATIHDLEPDAAR